MADVMSKDAMSVVGAMDEAARSVEDKTDKQLLLEIGELRKTNPPECVPSNPHFGVGPIMAPNAGDAVQQELEQQELNGFICDQVGLRSGDVMQSMHRTEAALKVTHNMMRVVAKGLGIDETKSHKLALINGGATAAFSAGMRALIDPTKKVFVDCPDPRRVEPQEVGAFTYRWAKAILECFQQQRSDVGSSYEGNVVFAEQAGHIPSAKWLAAQGVERVVGVANETTRCTVYNEEDIQNLQEWVEGDRENRHVLLDLTSFLGSQRMDLGLFNFFTPLQKALGGAAQLGVLGLNSSAEALIERMDKTLFVGPLYDVTKRRSDGGYTLEGGPIYDPETDTMSPVLNTLDVMLLCRSWFKMLKMQEAVGSLSEQAEKSQANLRVVEQYVENSKLLKLSVEDKSRRSTATTLIEVVDDTLSPEDKRRAVQYAKDYLGRKGVKRPNGEFIEGRNIADNLDAYPGMLGDFRFWMGAVRPSEDIEALLQNIEYAYAIGKSVVLEERLLREFGSTMPVVTREEGLQVGSKPARDLENEVIKGIIIDPIGLPDIEEARDYIESKGWIFHDGPISDEEKLCCGVHVSYQPGVEKDSLISQTNKGQYDFGIAAASDFPEECYFPEGVVRMGAGINNIKSKNCVDGKAPLMNTPGVNSATTAEVWKHALLDALMDLPGAHRDVMEGRANSKDLSQYHKSGVAGKRIAILGITGNVGHEVAKRAKAMGMQVVGWGRSFTPEQAMQMGVEYAATPVDAATGADVVSPHVQLEMGVTDGFVGKEIFDAMKPDGILINFARGQIVNPVAAREFLKNPKATLITDADIFLDGSGPLQPFVDLARSDECAGRCINYPHLAADADHPTRVDALKLAVDMMEQCLLYRRVTNLANGKLPDGYFEVGKHRVPGVGQVSAQEVREFACNPMVYAAVKQLSALMEGGANLTKSQCADLMNGLAVLTGSGLGNRAFVGSAKRSDVPPPQVSDECMKVREGGGRAV